MIVNKKYLIGQELLRREIITQRQLDEAIEYQKEHGVRLGRSLMELGYIKENDLLRVLADQLGIMYVDFDSVEIDNDVLSMVPAELARKYCLFPVKYDNEILTICVDDPLNINMMYDVQTLDIKIVPAISGIDDIKAAVEKYYA